MQQRTNRTRLFTIVGAGYLVLLVFGLGYFATGWWDDSLSTRTKITVGALLAAPLVIAFIWNRIKAVKGFGFEVVLADVTINVSPVNPKLEEAIATQQFYSGQEAILDQISQAVQNPDQQLEEINLHSKPYWWSTRLYLHAALLMDYSNTSDLIFVEGDRERRYIGITSTRDLRDALAEFKPCFKMIYHQLASQNLSVGNLIKKWVEASFEGQNEIDIKTPH